MCESVYLCELRGCDWSVWVCFVCVSVSWILASRPPCHVGRIGRRLIVSADLDSIQFDSIGFDLGSL